MPAKVQIIFYSMYGHVWKLAEAVAEGARSVAGTDVQIFQVAETLPTAVLEKMGAVEAKKAFAGARDRIERRSGYGTSPRTCCAGRH